MLRSIATLALFMTAMGAWGGPYASQISWSATSVDFDAQTVDVYYTLNAAADSVTIDVIPNGGGAAVASFSGATSVGSHTVTWNGTTDNGSGSVVADGDYRLEIQVQESGPAGWQAIRTNTTLGGTGDLTTLPIQFPARGVAVDTDPDSAHFGEIHITMSRDGDGGTHGIIRLAPDLNLINGGALVLDGLAWTDGETSDLSPWGIDVAEGGEIWAVGQRFATNAVEIGRGWPDGTGDTDVGIGHALVAGPRDILVTGSGSGRVIRWTQGTLGDGAVIRANIGNASTLSGVSVVTEVDGSFFEGFFGRSLDMDDGGNLYLLARGTQTGGVTHVYRFDASDLAGTLPLDAADASWDVEVTGIEFLNGSAVTIDHGDPSDTTDDVIYAVIPLNSVGGDEAGIYRVGVSGTATRNVTLSSADKVVDLSGTDRSDERTDIACDYAGNVVFEDPLSEVVQAFSPPGPSDITSPGPTSEVLTVQGGGSPVAPVITAIGDSSTPESSAYTGPTPSLTQGTLPVTWSLVTGPSGMTINSTSGVVSWPNPVTTGSPHTVTIRAANSAGNDDESWQLTVTPVVIAPIIASIDNSSIQAPTAYTGPTPSLTQGTTPVTWSLVTGPSGMTINSGTGVVSWPTSTATGSPHSITIRATNSAGSDDESWQLTVTSASLAPIIVPIGDDSVQIPNSYTGPTPSLSQGTAPITWTLVQSPSGMTINPTTGIVSWLSPTMVGSPHTVTIRATNSVGNDDESWLLTVSDAPQTPVISPIDNAAVQAPNSYTGPTPSLIEGDPPVTWSLVTGPSGMTINSTSGVVSWPTSTTVGSPHTVTIRATNSVGNDTETWTLTVNPAPVPPVINAIENETIHEPDPYLGPTPTLSQGTPPITWSIVTAPQGVVIDPATGVVSRSSSSVLGSPFTFTIRATNSAGSDDETWLVTVLPPLVAPIVADILDANVVAPSAYASGPASLVQGSLPVTWSLIQGPAGMTIDSESGAVSWPISTPTGSPHTVTIRATNEAGSDDESWLIHVNPPPTPPLIVSIADDTIEAPDTYVGPTPSLSQGTTPVTWSLVTSSSGMTINSNTGVVTWTTSTDVGSPHTITIRATNAAGSDDETWSLTVTPEPLPPVIGEIGDTIIQEPAAYEGPLPSLTQGTEPITWSLIVGPSGMTIDSGTGVVSWPTSTVTGSPFTITIRATNSEGSDEESWQLTVWAVPVSPEIHAIADAEIESGSAYTGPTPTLAQGTLPVSWSLIDGPSGMSIVPETGVVTWSGPLIAGSPHTVTIRAANGGGSDDESWQLTVVEPKLAPVIDPIDDDTVQEPESYTGPTPALSQGTPPMSWTLVTGPAGMTIDPSTGVVTWPTSAAAGSPHAITIEATNSKGSDQETWQLTVTPIPDPPLIAALDDASVQEGTSYTGPTPSLVQGTPPITWYLIAAPAGMTINAQTGVVGWPSPSSVASPHTITIRASNAAGNDDETWLLTVSAAGVSPTIAPIADDTVGEPAPYTGPTPSLTQGTVPVSWSLIAGPTGMTIDSGTGVVSWAESISTGSPYTVTIRATNAEGSDDESWQLTVQTVMEQVIDGLLGRGTPMDINDDGRENVADLVTQINNQNP